jgi:pyrrolidone-carboxylate peptidase
MPVTILVTGFGPFPGAPFNPTGPLVQRLARLRRPVLANTKIVPHIFPTSYAAVDRDLHRLIARHKPNVLLMFGLAPRAKTIRFETRARNSVSLLPDAGGIALRRLTIAAGGPAALAMPAPARRFSQRCAWRACQPRYRAMPDVICAITCAGARPRRRAKRAARVSRPSSMCPKSGAGRFRAPG